jgi:hypothetical protein
MTFILDGELVMQADCVSRFCEHSVYLTERVEVPWSLGCAAEG